MKLLIKRSKSLLTGVACALIGALATSCIPQKQIVLVRDVVPDAENYKPTDQITDRYVLQPNDYLFINVSSPDPNLSTFYNPSQSNRTGSSTNQRADLFYYGLDDSCNIDFPVVGRINLSGCTVPQAKKIIHDEIAKTLNGFVLTVRLATNTFSILGEVNKQGSYTMSRNQITIFDAISQAGGFTSYAKRKEVKLLRKNDKGELQSFVIDMTNGEFIESDIYYVYPNDVIYVRPVWHKVFGFGETFSVAFVSSLITLYVLIRSL